MRDYDKIEKTLDNLERELRSKKDYESGFGVNAHSAPCPSSPSDCFPIKNIYGETICDLIIKDINSGFVDPQEYDWLKLTLYQENFIKMILKGLNRDCLKPTVQAIQKEITQTPRINARDYTSPYYLRGDGNQFRITFNLESPLWAQVIEGLLEAELADRKKKSMFAKDESKNPCLDDPTFLFDADKQISDCCTFRGAVDEELLHTVLQDQNFDNHNWRTFFHDFSGGFAPARLFGQIKNEQTLRWCYEDILNYAKTNSTDLFFSSYDSNKDSFDDECEVNACYCFENTLEEDIKDAYTSVVERNKMLAKRKEALEDRISHLSKEEQADYNQCCEEWIQEFIRVNESIRGASDDSYAKLREENNDLKAKVKKLEKELSELSETESSVVQSGQKPKIKNHFIKARAAVGYVQEVPFYNKITQNEWEHLLSKLTGIVPVSFHKYWSEK